MVLTENMTPYGIVLSISNAFPEEALTLQTGHVNNAHVCEHISRNCRNYHHFLTSHAQNMKQKNLLVKALG